MTRKIYLLILGLLLGVQSYAQVIPGGGTVAPGPSSAITGNLQTATGGNVTNGTLSFSISQPAVVSGTSTLVGSSVSCYTSNTGNIVGLPEPLAIPVVNTVLGTGTLPAATYYVKFAYLGANGTSLASPEATVVLESIGSLDIPTPAIQPTAATGFFAVYIGTTPGGETLQGIATGWTQFAQSSPLVTGSPVPSVNTSSCNVYLSDELIPTGTYYTVSLTNKNGAQIAGFPQTWCTYGGENATINVSNGAPTGNCGTNGVFYPTPIFANPQNGAAQSINGLVSFPQGANVTGLNATTGQNELGQVNSFNNVLHVGSGITVWGTSDIGAQINNAYAALPSTGGTIIVDPNPNGTCYDYSTGIAFTTSGKYVFLDGGGIGTAVAGSGPTHWSGGACLNFIPTTNQAIQSDYVPLVSENPPTGHGIRNIAFINNQCSATGGCGGSANGLVIGNVNGGAYDATYTNVAFIGFGGYGYLNTNSIGVNSQWFSPFFQANGAAAIQLGALTEKFFGGVMAGNTLVLNCAANSGCEPYFLGVNMFSNLGEFDFTNQSLSNPAHLHLIATHNEHSAVGGAHFIQGIADWDAEGSIFEDDNATGTADWMFSNSGSAFSAHGITILSNRPYTNIFLMNSPSRGDVALKNDSPSILTDTMFLGGANTDFLSLAITKAGSSNAASPRIFEGPLKIGGGIIGDGSGFKHKRFASPLGGTCPTAGSAGAPCTSGNLNWTTAFVDNNYSVSCTLLSPTGQPHLSSVALQAAGAGITVTIAADTAVAANAAVDCIAVHD